MKKFLIILSISFISNINSSHFFRSQYYIADNFELIMQETEKRIYEVNMIFCGDIMVHDRFLNAFSDNGNYDFTPLFEEFKTEKADLFMANLETTLPGERYHGYPNFRAPDSILDALKKIGITHLNLCNNHSLDSGIRGLIRTNKTCKEHGFTVLGTYIDREEDHFIQDIKGIRFGFLSYTYGTNEIKLPKGYEHALHYINKDKIKKDILKVRESSIDFLFVIIHFGKEYLYHPDEFQKDIVSFLFKEGVNFVIGMHAHTVQPFVYDENENDPRFAAFSLGNFASVQQRYGSDIGCMLYLKFSNNNGIKKLKEQYFKITFREYLKKDDKYRIIIIDEENEERIILRKHLYDKVKDILKASDENIKVF